jgi:branched-chain amino acid transport system substrate-binding protein
VLDISSGPVQITTATRALEAYIAGYNERGGRNGRPVELVVRDGSFDPGKAAAAARELVDQEEVVGMAGSVSFPDCP